MFHPLPLGSMKASTLFESESNWRCVGGHTDDLKDLAIRLGHRGSRIQSNLIYQCLVSRYARQ